MAISSFIPKVWSKKILDGLALATCVKAYSLAGAKVVIPGAVACYFIS